jgi:predicted component of type VI protein secretion system
MNVRLVLERKGKRIWTAQLRGSEATLGRAFGCTIRIPSSEISRRHCRLRVENDLVTVEDLESINGTFVNGRRIREAELVRPGDRLSLGPVTFVVEYALTAEALRRLGGESECMVLEADAEASLLEELPAAEALEEVEEVEEAGDEMFVLDDDEAMNLPEGGDLRDFLIELDDTDDRSGRGR